jgi:FkbM family methyltransferase
MSKSPDLGSIPGGGRASDYLGAHAGEDEWIRDQFPPGYRGYACELGALDGAAHSNTLLLEQSGWDVLCIEPNPDCWGPLVANRKLCLRCACDAEPRDKATLWTRGGVQDEPGRHKVWIHSVLRTAGHTKEIDDEWKPFETTVLTLNQCLMATGFDRLDVLSLDVDGIEWDILKGFDFDRWRPKVLCIEVFGRHDFGEWIRSHGYTPVALVGHNTMFLSEA